MENMSSRNEVCEKVCEREINLTVKEIMANNYELLMNLECILSIIAKEVKKTDIPELNLPFSSDMVDAMSDHSMLLDRCLDHANYIKRNLGIGN